MLLLESVVNARHLIIFLLLGACLLMIKSIVRKKSGRSREDLLFVFWGALTACKGFFYEISHACSPAMIKKQKLDKHECEGFRERKRFLLLVWKAWDKCVVENDWQSMDKWVEPDAASTVACCDVIGVQLRFMSNAETCD